LLREMEKRFVVTRNPACPVRLFDAAPLTVAVKLPGWDFGAVGPAPQAVSRTSDVSANARRAVTLMTIPPAERSVYGSGLVHTHAARASPV
jgi:hypothetical protein